MRYFVKTAEGNVYQGEYKNFVIATEAEDYALTIEDFNGTAVDFEYENGQKFSTWDHDDDNSIYSNCALINGGGWWYNACYQTCLTGTYDTHFEAKDLGSDSLLSEMRIMLIRYPDESDNSDTYGHSG
jgi:hypothetical protein